VSPVGRSSGLLAPLDRGELDELIRVCELAEQTAHIALVNAPLDPLRIERACGVAQDCLCLYHEALDESIARMLAGEVPAR